MCDPQRSPSSSTLRTHERTEQVARGLHTAGDVIIGEGTQRVIIRKVVTPVAIISHVYAYLSRRKDSDQLAVAVHIVSDGGKADTIVGKLIRRAHDEVVHTLRTERPENPKHLRWRHSNSTLGVPTGAQLVYVRPEVV